MCRRYWWDQYKAADPGCRTVYWSRSGCSWLSSSAFLTFSSSAAGSAQNRAVKTLTFTTAAFATRLCRRYWWDQYKAMISAVEPWSRSGCSGLGGIDFVGRPPEVQNRAVRTLTFTTAAFATQLCAEGTGGTSTKPLISAVEPCIGRGLGVPASSCISDFKSFGRRKCTKPSCQNADFHYCGVCDTVCRRYWWDQ